jgi:hypothetical protein
LTPATDRKATVKAVQQRFPNHDANLSCALHRFDPFARRFDFDQRRGSRLLQSLRMSTTLALAARAVPRYTSYPTAPHFSSDVGAETYAARLAAPDLAAVGLRVSDRAGIAAVLPSLCILRFRKSLE